jgi:hypothetical protein
MNRRRFIFRWLLGLAAVLLSWLTLRRRSTPTMAFESPADRVVFVCCDDHESYSPGVYLHGVTGGGPACLDLAKKSARYLRAGEANDSAAGLCGFLFSAMGEDSARGGVLSLWDAPRSDSNGNLDWKSYCPWNVDLILINVDRKTAECFANVPYQETSEMRLVGQITGLEFGG